MNGGEDVRAAGFAQEREWFLDQLDPGTPAYNMSIAIRLTGRLDVPALERSISWLVRRHPALRTRIAAVDGAPLQIISRALHVPLPTAHARPAADGGVEGAIRAAIARELSVGFALDRGPLIRTRLLRCGAQEHVFLMTLHHIVADAWSLGILFRELEAAYNAFVTGGAPAFPEPPLTYADVVGRQREAMSGERLRRQLRYWVERLAGAAPALDLATDFPHPPRQTFAGDIFRFEIPERSASPFFALASSERTTPFMAMTTALAALLARRSRQDDILIGTYVANRSAPGTDGVVGFVVNTVALRVDVSGDPPFRELLRRTRAVVLGAVANAEVPFERVLDAVRPVRDPRRTPLFQVAADVHEPLAAPRLHGLESTLLDTESSRAEYDLELRVALRRAAACRFKYRTDLFEAATVGRLAEQLRAIVDTVGATPDVRVGELPLLDAGDRRSVLELWARGPGAPSGGGDLAQLFSRQVARTPEAPALQAPSGTVSYGDLDVRVGRLAAALRGAGVRPETVVGVFTEPALDAVVALLAVLRAGGAFLALDPAYPDERLRYMLEDAGTALAIVAPEQRPRVPARLPMLAVGAAVAAANTDLARVDVAVRPETPAYVVYTSGSTGRPKATAVSHANLEPLLSWSRDFFGIGPRTHTLQNLSLAFDFGLYETLLTCLFGGCLHLPWERPLVPMQLEAYANAQGVTALHATPSQLAQLGAAGVRLESLELLHLGGEELTWELVRVAERCVPPTCRIFNGYGPTENTVNTTLFEVPRGTARDERSPTVPIGSPTAANRAYVLDERLEPVDVGAAGELVVGGAGVTRGYVDRPALTAERFVPDPFEGGGGRLYRTGDLARRRADGLLECLGRLDGQVKLRGFRIEPGEVEAALAAHSSVRHAAVVARAGPGHDQRLIAYVVRARGRVLDARELRAFLARSLPEFMLPAAFVTIPELPQSPNGKVDRRQLAQRDVPPPARTPYVPPRTEEEQAIARIWSELLGAERVGRDDTFFDLGGHSLLAARAVARIRDALRVDVPLRAVFDAPTVAELALVAAAHREDARAPLPRIERVERERVNVPADANASPR